MTTENKGFLSNLKKKKKSTHKGDGCQAGLYHNKSFCTQKVSPTKGSAVRQGSAMCSRGNPGTAAD